MNAQEDQPGIFVSKNFPKEVTIHEVGPREGLQSQAVVMGTAEKIKFIENLAQTGIKRIETTGFFHPVKFPQLADADEVMKSVTRDSSVRYMAHIPNEVGLKRARGAGVDAVIMCLSASDETARREDDDCKSTNDCLINKTQRLIPEAREAGMWVRIFLTNTWGCPYEGPISPQKVVQLCEALMKSGVDEICLADNLGAATPSDVDNVLRLVYDVAPADRLAVHFHDNRGMAIANTLAALALGISVIDTSAGGLGGHANCSYIPLNPAMVATEDVLFMLQGMGINTGVDTEKVRSTAHSIAELLHVPLLGRYSVAGPVERVP